MRRSSLGVLGVVTGARHSANDPGARLSRVCRWAAAEVRPNILFLMVDDMRRDELRFMPAHPCLDRAGGRHIQQRRDAQSAVLSRSRASVLSGLHAHNHKVWSHSKNYGFHAFDDRFDPRGCGCGAPATPRRTWASTSTSTGSSPAEVVDRTLGAVRPARDGHGWRASIDGGLPARHPTRGHLRYFDTTLNNDGQRLSSATRTAIRPTPTAK